MKKFLITCAFLTALPVYLCAADGGDDIRFSILNWLIIAVFLIATTVIGERLKGKNRNLNDFFLGGKSVPWWAVSFSMIATKTSVSTFIAVPAFVFSAAGNLTYLQMTLGFILGNFLFVFVLLKQYYQEGVYSPYDFIQNRLGTKTSQLSRSLFMLGATLSQGVRLLGTALVLSVITGLDTLVCILIIVVFSIIWSYLGGITTVIWTDVIQFIIFFVTQIISYSIN